MTAPITPAAQLANTQLANTQAALQLATQQTAARTAAANAPTPFMKGRSMRMILLGVSALSSIGLTPTLAPGMIFFETDFNGFNNLNIQGDRDQGSVTKLLWGMWNLCYSVSGVEDYDICTPRHFIDHPYDLTIVENGNQAHGTIGKTWPRVLFMQFAGCFANFVIIPVIFYAFYHVDKIVQDQPSDYYAHNNTVGQPALIMPRSDDQEKKKTGLQILMYLGYIPFLFSIAIVFAENFVYRSIEIELQSLAVGNPTMVGGNNSRPGFVLSMLFNWIIIVVSCYIICSSWLEYKKLEVDVQYAKSVENTQPPKTLAEVETPAWYSGFTFLHCCTPWK